MGKHGKIPWTSRKRTGSSGFGLPNSSFHMGASAMEQRLSRLTSLLITRLKEWLLNSYNVGLTSNDRRYISHDGSMVLLYMVCHGSHQYTPFMLAYIAAPWILWVYIYIIYIYTLDVSPCMMCFPGEITAFPDLNQCIPPVGVRGCNNKNMGKGRSFPKLGVPPTSSIVFFRIFQYKQSINHPAIGVPTRLCNSQMTLVLGMTRSVFLDVYWL